jgi:hypothetical protein
MNWNYFATGHGKGEVNGAAALLKREIQKEQIKPNAQKLQCALNVVNFLKVESLKQHITAHPNMKRTIHKYFWKVKKDDIDRTHFYEF